MVIGMDVGRSDFTSIVVMTPGLDGSWVAARHYNIDRIGRYFRIRGDLLEPVDGDTAVRMAS